MTQAIAYHIAKDGVPLYTVEKPGFRQIVAKLNPRYDLPSRKYFSSREIPGLYSSVCDNVLRELRPVTHFAATIDLWTSTSCEPYITVTIHYINEWSHRSICLDTVTLFTDHTDENIAQSITDILANCELKTDYLIAATTDSGSIAIVAF